MQRSDTLRTDEDAAPTRPASGLSDGIVDSADAPDTIPDTSQDGELLEALEWLKKAGIVSVDNKPPFASFFDEAVEGKAG